MYNSILTEATDLTNIPEADDDDSEVEEPDFEIPPPDDMPELLQPEEEEEEEEEEEDGEAAVGDRSLHSMSGTTALDRQSQAGEESQIDPISPYPLLIYGASAYRAATALLTRFNVRASDLPRILEVVNDPDTLNGSEFEREINDLDEAILQLDPPFENGGLTSPEYTMQALFVPSSPNKTSECWYTEELIQLLNLAILVRQIATRSPEDAVDMLDRLDAQFPLPFIKDLQMQEDGAHIVGFSRLRDKTFQAALAIRLQSAVLKLKRDHEDEERGIDVDDTARESFFASEDTQTLRAWPQINGLGGGDLGLLPEFDSKMRRTIKRLIGAAQEDLEDIQDGSEDDLKVLEMNFPWDAFRTSFIEWAKLRVDEIVQSIEGIGGVNYLLQVLQTELEKGANFDLELVIAPTQSPDKGKKKAVPAR